MPKHKKIKFMENKTKHQVSESLDKADYADQDAVSMAEPSSMDKNLPATKQSKKDYFLPASILIAAVVISGTWIYTAGSRSLQSRNQIKRLAQAESTVGASAEKVLPAKGVILPVTWGDLGKKMADAGVIDKTAFEALYSNRGGLASDMKPLLDSQDNGQIVMTSQNAGVLLNLFWVLGLSTKNPILDNGPMQNPQYGGAANFASTGGWTLAKGNIMTHYSAHQFMTLTADEQKLVEGVAKGIYRPCCRNSVYFPDCNHGMAMLGLLELMASQGATEDMMYKAALAVNSYWFPDMYLTIARYFESKGSLWSTVDPREALGSVYSSAQGYAKIQTLIAPEPPTQSQGGCGVDSGPAPAQTQTTQPHQQQVSCGV